MSERRGSKGKGSGTRRRTPKPKRSKPAPPPAPAPPSRRALTALRVAMTLVAAAVAAVAFAASLWLLVLFPSERGPGEGRSVEIDVVRDMTPGDLAATLSAAGMVRRPRFFALWVRLTGGTRGVATGQHLLTDDASARELMARLERRNGGRSVRVTFPEGFTRFDMARRLQDKEVVSLRAFLDATADPSLLRELGIDGDSAEGFLFPATYDLAMDSDAGEVVRRLKREFDRRWDALSRTHDASLNDVMTSAKMSVRDVVTLASMVEKEAAVDDERPIIASVFLNRLRDPDFKPKHLECDPTASYGCLVSPEKAASCEGFTGKATAAIEHDPDNPYSTYTHEGLPPGPIANPGAASLAAAMAPSSTRYLFFVARGGGRHTFSETYGEHVGAVHGAARVSAAKAKTVYESPESP